MKLKRLSKRILLGLGAIFVALQFIPAHLDPPIASGRDLLSTNAPPPEISQMIQGACYDCHSDQTQWPWYNRVAPVSWWIGSHVNSGRKRLNFSAWPHDDPSKAARKLSHISDEVSAGSMPLPSYTWMHPAARLTAAQREQLSKWAEQEAERLRAANETKDKP
jgi:Haem-binding domain